MRPPKRAQRIQRDKRIIEKRKRIIRSVWTTPGNKPENNILHREPGRLKKYNMKCGCHMCAKPRYDRAKERKRDD